MRTDSRYYLEKGLLFGRARNMISIPPKGMQRKLLNEFQKQPHQQIHMQNSKCHLKHLH